MDHQSPLFFVHPATTTHSQGQEWDRGVHGTPARRSEEQQRVGNGLSSGFVAEGVGACRRADPCRGWREEHRKDVSRY